MLSEGYVELLRFVVRFEYEEEGAGEEEEENNMRKGK